MKIASECLAQTLPAKIISSVMAIESRGFIFGSVLSIVNNASFIMIRKAAKLPPVISNVFFDSKSEYSKEKLGFNSSYLSKGIILIHDDVLATGGTVKSVVEALINKCGINSSNIYLSFLVELSFLKGKHNLLEEDIIPETHIKSLIVYEFIPLKKLYVHPRLTLSFMALLVIPELKLSDKGLFDGRQFRHVTLFVDQT